MNECMNVEVSLAQLKLFDHHLPPAADTRGQLITSWLAKKLVDPKERKHDPVRERNDR
jgi:hypothetical protein